MQVHLFRRVLCLVSVSRGRDQRNRLRRTPTGGRPTSFHTYAVELDRSTSIEQLRWYLDGNNYFTVNANQVPASDWNNAAHHGFFVILNVAIGGGFPSRVRRRPNRRNAFRATDARRLRLGVYHGLINSTSVADTFSSDRAALGW